MSPAHRMVTLPALALAVAACASRSPEASPEELREARALQPSPGNAVLYFARSETRRKGWGDTVHLDGVLQGGLNNGDFFRFVLAPGEHELQASIGTQLAHLPCPAPGRFTARAGDTLFAMTLGDASAECAGVNVFLDDGAVVAGPAVSPLLLDQLKAALPAGNLLLPTSAGRVLAALAPGGAHEASRRAPELPPGDALAVKRAEADAAAAAAAADLLAVKRAAAATAAAAAAAAPPALAPPVAAPAAAGVPSAGAATAAPVAPQRDRAKFLALEIKALLRLASQLPPGLEADQVRARLAIAQADLAALSGGAPPPEPARSSPPAAAAPPPARPSAPAAAAPAAAFARGAAQPTAFALVIGVERYRDLPPPTGARADAERFVELARTTLGVPERHVLVALDDRATRSDLEKHLAWLERNVPAGGRIYLFFAGHGAPDPASGTSYLLPYDADPAALSGTALKLSDLTARLGRTKARDVVGFLDSCFSGTGGRSVIAAGTRPLVPVQKLASAPKVSILSAVTGAQVTGATASGSGLFSHFLFEGLGGGKADLDGDAQITIKELRDWVAPRVEREAKLDNREQLPGLTTGKGVDAGACVVATGVTGG